MTEKVFIEVTSSHANIKKQMYTLIEGKEYAVGDPNRNSYKNSVLGRQALQNEVADPYRSAILTVWGNTPTVPDTLSE